MRIFKTKVFHEWSLKEGLYNSSFVRAVEELRQGLVESNLGGNLYKKRIAIPGRGKRVSARTIIAYRQHNEIFFLFGFSKNQRDNITKKELSALKLLATQLLNLSEHEITLALRENELIEVLNDE